MSLNNNTANSSSTLTTTTTPGGGGSGILKSTSTTTTNKALIPNANDLQSKLAKLQQNIAQKLNKSGVAPLISSSTPINVSSNSGTSVPSVAASTTTIPKPKNNVNTTTTTTLPSTSSSLTKVIPKVGTSSEGVLPPPQLNKIQKPNSHAPTTLGKVTSQVQKSLQAKPNLMLKPNQVTKKPISATPTTTVLNNSNTMSNAAVLNIQQDDDEEENSMEKQIYMKDYQKKRETSQIQQQYQQELLQHEQNQQELENSNKKKKKNLRTVYTASGKSEVWEDSRLDEFSDNDYRIHANNLGNEVTDQMLSTFFSSYASFSKGVVIRDKRTNRSKGFGFISFLDVNDYVHALENMNGKYLGNRPLQLKPSKWKDRNLK